MANVNEVLNITATIGGAAVDTASFGVGLGATPHTNTLNTVDTYTGVPDDFQEGDAGYDSLKAVFLQSPSPSQFKIGRIGVESTKVTVVGTGQVTVGNEYKLECADTGDTALTEVSYTSVATSDTVTVVTTGAAGAADFSFVGATADAAMYLTGYTFALSGNTTPAANATYTVRAPGAAELAGVVTVPIVEALPAATADGDLTVADDIIAVAAGLTAAHAGPGFAQTAADNGDGTMTVTVGTTGDPMVVRTTNRGRLTVAYVTLSAAGASEAAQWKASLDDILAADSTFLYVGITSRDKDVQDGVFEWINLNEKLSIMASSDANIIGLAEAADTSTIAYLRDAANYKRNIMLYNSTADGTVDDEWVDFADIAANIIFDPDAPQNPGRWNNWTYKNLAGVTSDADNLTATNIANLVAKSVDWYGTVQGVDAVVGGDTISGGGGLNGAGYEFSLDYGVLWMKARLQERFAAMILSMSASLGRYAFTQKDINAFKIAISDIFELAVTNGFLMRDTATYGPLGYQVIVPDEKAILTADKLAEILRGMSAKGKSAGTVGHVIFNFNIGT